MVGQLARCLPCIAGWSVLLHGTPFAATALAQANSIGAEYLFLIAQSDARQISSQQLHPSLHQ